MYKFHISILHYVVGVNVKNNLSKWIVRSLDCLKGRPVAPSYINNGWENHKLQNVISYTDKITLELFQWCAARWTCGRHWSPSTNRWSKSSDVCLQELQWPTLASSRNYLSVSMMHDIMYDRYSSLKLVDYRTFNSSCTCAHSICLVPPQNKLFHSLFVCVCVCAVLMLSPPKFCPAVCPL